MTDEELKRWWPVLGTVVAELRRSNQSDVSDMLIDAVRSGATSGEILGNVGIVLHTHRQLYLQMSDDGARAWDAVIADVYRACPISRLRHYLSRLRRSGR